MARKASTCVQTSSNSVDSSLFNSWPSGIRWGHNGEMEFYIGILREIFKNLLKNYKTKTVDTHMEATSGYVVSNLFKSWSPGVGWGHNRGMEFFIGICRENPQKSSS